MKKLYYLTTILSFPLFIFMNSCSCSDSHKKNNVDNKKERNMSVENKQESAVAIPVVSEKISCDSIRRDVVSVAIPDKQTEEPIIAQSADEYSSSVSDTLLKNKNAQDIIINKSNNKIETNTVSQKEKVKPKHKAKQEKVVAKGKDNSTKKSNKVKSAQPKDKERYFALKTNLLGWGTGAINAAAELQLDSHVSLEFSAYYSPWQFSSKHSLQHFTIQPEGRYWFNEVGRGHFTGVHLLVSWYNLKWNNYRYQDSEALWGIGVNYGYNLQLSEHWSTEFTLGLGYMRAYYDKFYNVNNGAFIEQKSKSLLGLTRLGVSFVYNF